MLPPNDTIAAIATANGRGGIGVVRISGRGAVEIATKILGCAPTPRHAYLADFKDSADLLIDKGLLLFFVAPHSYTGEDVLELQGHGGLAVLHMVLKRCLDLGARLAEPGEFTRRAYLNNKLDLAQAEAVADLIEATTTQAARSAIRSLNGEFSTAINLLVGELINLRMLVEAMLDFPEEDLDTVDLDRRNKQLSIIRNRLDATLQTAKQGSLMREGVHVALVGQPNVGKSSLLNRLSGEEIALVSDIPGTTRDVIKNEIHINGIPMHIMDTAGLRESDDVIEKMGIALTHQTIKKADLIIFICDANKPVNTEDLVIYDTLLADIPKIVVFNKSDLLLEDNAPHLEKEHIFVSAKTGKGIDSLRSKLLELIGWNNQGEGVFMARERHLIALNEANDKLLLAEKTIEYPEFFAEELRLAQAALNKITGEFTADDLLGEIFSRFCIGK